MEAGLREIDQGHQRGSFGPHALSFLDQFDQENLEPGTGVKGPDGSSRSLALGAEGRILAAADTAVSPTSAHGGSRKTGHMAFARTPQKSPHPAPSRSTGTASNPVRSWVASSTGLPFAAA